MVLDEDILSDNRMGMMFPAYPSDLVRSVTPLGMGAITSMVGPVLGAQVACDANGDEVEGRVPVRTCSRHAR